MKVAVVLFNLGGPDSLGAVRPFLFNLFKDPAIIGAPQPIRWLLARWISWRRERTAKDIYRRLGGNSPLLELTKRQGEALERLLKASFEARVFIAMRYWHPLSDEVAREVEAYRPDRVVLLPLYPQYSKTTTGSSIKDWRRAATMAGLTVETVAVCCYPTEGGWIEAQSRLIRNGIEMEVGRRQLRVLFSAHGLPKKVIAGGDPYQWQVEETARAVVKDLGIPDLDWTICYQSRVGPLEWIGPSIEEELIRAASDGVGVVVVPIAFVSEHSETLVELDQEYRERAGHLGIAPYIRIPAVGTEEAFIRGLAAMAERAARGRGIGCGGDGSRCCPEALRGCAMMREE